MKKFTPIDHVKNARTKKKSHQAFYTPLDLVNTMVSTLRIPPGTLALEPSAGDGRIAHALIEAGYSVDACEIDEAMYATCEGYGANMVGRDFLALVPEKQYDLIVMNPPFQGKLYAKHIEHAFKFLSTRGELVAIAPDTIKDLLVIGKLNLPQCDSLQVEDLPPDAFKESGASPKTVLITATKSSGVSVECDGYSNWATFNVAVAIASDRDLSDIAIRFVGGELSGDVEATFRRELGKRNIYGYGVNWKEVEQDLRDRLTNESAEHKPAAFHDNPAGNSTQLSLFEMGGVA